MVSAVKKSSTYLENVAIAKALQLEAVRATPALSRFHYDAMPSLKSPNLSIAVFAADTLLYDLTLTSDPVTLTFDLKHLQRIRIIAF